jgi:hypothetical protein
MREAAVSEQVSVRHAEPESDVVGVRNAAQIIPATRHRLETFAPPNATPTDPATMA